jgi:uncharacterized protein (TIGR02099 family)
LEHSFFHRLSNWLWTLIVLSVVTLAVYTSVGRLLMSNVGAWQHEILHQLNTRLPFTVEARDVRGEWRSFSPVLIFTDLQLHLPDTPQPVALSGGQIALNVAGSLRSRSLQFSQLQVEGLHLQGSIDEQGAFHVAGFGGGGGGLGPWLQDALLTVEQIELVANSLVLTPPQGSARELALDLLLRRDGSTRRLDAQLVSSTGTEITVIGEGLGNPFKPDRFRGQLYTRLDLIDLHTLRELLPGLAPDLRTQGAGELELWAGWERGTPSLELRLAAQQLLLSRAEGETELLLDAVALTANVLENNQHWTVFVSDLSAQSDGRALFLPRLQVDAWGDSLRVLAGEVALAPLSEFALGLPGVPATLAEVFTTLAPAGDVQRLELSLADLSQPTAEWQVEANFNDLEVASWRGAPGVTGARGFVRMTPGDGFLVLDSSDFEMRFPTVYEHPLRYEEIYGTLTLGWDKDAFYLGSGQLMARGEEGAASALFALNVPFEKTDAGLEMELLVGLEDSHPQYREKYLPYTLPQTLLNWLQGSIGEGRIEQGAFMWRGSLRLSASQLRSIGLFFNVADTELQYDPRWPPVSGLNGTVFIDDTDVSVWADSAQLYASELTAVSAEAWLDEAREMQLAVRGHLSGSAADGLRVVNESALTDVVGSTFADWQLSGALDTDLTLQLNLNNISAFPTVEVATHWQQVNLNIVPLSLSVEGINGHLHYSSAAGFSAQDLSGSLWQQPLRAQLRQAEAEVFDPRATPLHISLSSQVAAQDLQQWLQVEALSLASGRTAVAADITVTPGDVPVLSATTDLQGLALDLPEPWAKVEAARRELALALPLAGDEQVLSLNLDDDLFMKLRLAGREFGGAALGFQHVPNRVPQQALLLSGHAPLVEAQQWQAFIERYFFTGQRTSDASAEPAAGGFLPVQVEELQIDTLSGWGQDIRDLLVTLDHQPGQWQLAVESDWLQGELKLSEDFGHGSLAVNYLDLAQLSQFDLPSATSSDSRVPVLPSLAADLKGLHYGARELGELNFSLQSDGKRLVAHTIEGQLAGLAVAADQPGQLVWEATSTGTQTRLDAKLGFTDLGQSLEQLGYAKIVETDEGQFDAFLSWPGGPQDFSLAAGEGALKVALGQGRFLNSPPGATGALKVVSILNLTDLVGRLSLPQMFESGISFHEVEGEIFIHSGAIEVAEMEVKGTSSAFMFTGIAQVEQRTIDGELVVTLPVASNLPWVAALTVSWPVAAGVFLVSKVFEKQFDELSSGVYKIHGPWDDPQVNFDRVFDTDSQVLTSAHRHDPNAPSDPNGPLDPNQP